MITKFVLNAGWYSCQINFIFTFKKEVSLSEEFILINWSSSEYIYEEYVLIIEGYRMRIYHQEVWLNMSTRSYRFFVIETET